MSNYIGSQDGDDQVVNKKDSRNIFKILFENLSKMVFRL